MLNDTLPDVAVGCVFDDVSDVVQRATCPVASVRSNKLCGCRVASCIKRQHLASSHRCTGQCHVDGSRVSLRCAQCTLQTFGILLRKDGLLIHLIIDSVSKEVATSYKVCGALNCAVAHNGNLCRTSG